MKETELAQHFVEYLSCFDLYFEVDYYRSVDIVAVADNYAAAIEVKTSFNFKVLEQAISNAKYFHYSYIAVPYFGGSSFQQQLCKDYGIGLLVYFHFENIVREIVKPKLNRHADLARLKKRVCERNKQSLPGSKSGDSTKITAFGVTVDNLTIYVMRHPNCTLKDAVEKINHHYDTNQLARTNLAQWIRKGVIKNIEIEKGILKLTKS
jgi:hypothetical protein